MLTAEQRAEGRRLLAACNNVPDYEDFNDRYYDATDWLYKHAEALLAEPPAIDVEAIKREAVREFAEALLEESETGEFEHGETEAVFCSTIWSYCIPRGVNLDEKL